MLDTAPKLADFFLQRVFFAKKPEKTFQLLESLTTSRNKIGNTLATNSKFLGCLGKRIIREFMKIPCLALFLSQQRSIMVIQVMEIHSLG